eukprot:15346291-Ditylum_brightwellii.AAC.1
MKLPPLLVVPYVIGACVFSTLQQTLSSYHSKTTILLLDQGRWSSSLAYGWHAMCYAKHKAGGIIEENSIESEFILSYMVERIIDGVRRRRGKFH